MRASTAGASCPPSRLLSLCCLPLVLSLLLPRPRSQTHQGARARDVRRGDGPAPESILEEWEWDSPISFFGKRVPFLIPSTMGLAKEMGLGDRRQSHSDPAVTQSRFLRPPFGTPGKSSHLIRTNCFDPSFSVISERI
ncbi:hypothetical protein B0H14DRAFT_2584043 [Mycena olivaceomarginata]|nr:hypothetical protein B0H14DRAFT_2584043 [Mycena olivaceomarginata]